MHRLEAAADACSGTIVGVFLLGVVANALNLFGVSPFWQPVATGLILIAAVAFDGYSRRGVFAPSAMKLRPDFRAAACDAKPLDVAELPDKAAR